MFGQKENIDCKEFHKGRYFYTPPNGGEVTLKRTRKKQIERYNNENQKFIFEINWLSNCAYELILVNAKGISKEKKKEIIGSTLHCEVLSSALGHFTVRIRSNNSKETSDLIIYSK